MRYSRKPYEPTHTVRFRFSSFTFKTNVAAPSDIVARDLAWDNYMEMFPLSTSRIANGKAQSVEIIHR